MARPNPPRSIGSEDNLAERVQFEREARAWSPARLAQELTLAGCPIQTSAIYKIESAEQRRKISVDELVAFAKVFETTPEKLLVPLELVRQEQAAIIIREAEDGWQKLGRGIQKMTRAYIDLFRLAGTDHELSEYVINHVHGGGSESTQPGELFTFERDDGTSITVDTSKLKEAWVGLLAAVIDTASLAEQSMNDWGKNGEHQA